MVSTGKIWDLDGLGSGLVSVRVSFKLAVEVLWTKVVNSAKTNWITR